METKTEREIIPTFAKLVKKMADFSDENFNRIPFEGSWTAGQVAEHLRLSASTLTELLYGNVTETQRQPDERVPQIMDLFLNFETKLQSPDFILPEAKNYDRETMGAIFAKTKANLEKAARELDLSKTCEDFALPGFGKMTRLEWIAFVIYHIQRHTRQMENIHKKITS